MNSLQVDYGSGTKTQNLIDGRTVSISGFTPDSRIPLTVTVTNSMGSKSYTPPVYNLCESTPEAVQNLSSSQIESTSLLLQWDAPAVTNGDITGYAISQGDTKVHGSSIDSTIIIALYCCCVLTLQ